MIKSTFLMISAVALVVVIGLLFFLYSFFRTLPAIKQYDSCCNVSELQKEIYSLGHADTTISISNNVAIGVGDTVAWNMNISFSNSSEQFTIRYEPDKSLWNGKVSSKLSLTRISSANSRKVILENDENVNTLSAISNFEKRFVSRLKCIQR